MLFFLFNTCKIRSGGIGCCFHKNLEHHIIYPNNTKLRLHKINQDDQILPYQAQPLRRCDNRHEVIESIFFHMSCDVIADVNITLVVDDNDFTEQIFWSAIYDAVNRP